MPAVVVTSWSAVGVVEGNSSILGMSNPSVLAGVAMLVAEISNDAFGSVFPMPTCEIAV